MTSRRIDLVLYRIVFLTTCCGLLLFLPGVSTSTDSAYPHVIGDLPTQQLARGVLLVASREMTDPRFKETVILVTEHQRGGALGIIINRPTDIDMADIFPGIDVLQDNVMHPYIGGPVHPTFLSVLVSTQQLRKNMVRVVDNVFFGLGAGLAVDLIAGMNKEDKLHVYFGYAGWTAGQLEFELHRGDWYMIKADTKAIFDKDPATLWSEYIDLVTGVWL